MYYIISNFTEGCKKQLLKINEERNFNSCLFFSSLLSETKKCIYLLVSILLVDWRQQWTHTQSLERIWLPVLASYLLAWTQLCFHCCHGKPTFRFLVCHNAKVAKREWKGIKLCKITNDFYSKQVTLLQPVMAAYTQSTRLHCMSLWFIW